MTEFAPGMRVVVRDEEWMIKKVERNTMGENALHCIGVSPLVKDRAAIFIADIDSIVPVDPTNTRLIVDESSHYRQTLLYIESQWRQCIPTDDRLHIGSRAAMDTMRFQLEPAQKALRQVRSRILIADAVGLGKTLEAGILMSELILRGKGKRILVVTGKAMMLQFQKEMWNRFTIPLVRLDSAKIRQIRNSLPANYNPFFYYDKTIISIDTLKNDLAYRTHLENAYWDIIVIDEAQSVATRGSKEAQRAKLARLLASRSDTMIMLSATPHDGRARSFASLMNMLDPTAIANPDSYTKEEIKGLYIRRFKKDVKDQMAGVVLERELTVEHATASLAEEDAYAMLAGIELDMDATRQSTASHLFRTTLEKALFSSPAACVKTITERIKRLKQKYNDTEIKDIKLLTEFKDAVERITPANFSRYQRLLALLQSSEYAWDRRAKDDRLVIFTERVDTMEFLYAQLAADLKLKKGEIAKISGAMSDEEQQQIVDDFGRLESKVRILVASDVASEGLNLHYLAHRLIHFDMPWSLMVFQQRNGRIDRYGQTRRPDIRYFLTSTQNEKINGDLHLLEILIEKEEQAIKNIGDPAMLLGKYDADAEAEVVAAAIERGENADSFGETLEETAGSLDIFDLLGLDDASESDNVELADDETIYPDTEYLYQAIRYIGEAENSPVERLTRKNGLDITLTDAMRQRLRATLPQEVYEALKSASYLRLLANKDDIMQCVRERQQSKDSNSWLKESYLWPLHPIFDWVNERVSMLYARDEAPLAVMDALPAGTMLFILAGTIPNRKSTPLIDEYFALKYEGDTFVEKMSLASALALARLNGEELANSSAASTATSYSERAERLLPQAIAEGRRYLSSCYQDYDARCRGQVDSELARLAALECEHKSYQQELFASRSERQLTAEINKITEVFERFSDYVRDTMTAEDSPYIRVIAVLAGR